MAAAFNEDLGRDADHAGPGAFVTRRNDEYQLVDAGSRVIELPGKSGLALRLHRVGVGQRPASIELPEE